MLHWFVRADSSNISFENFASVRPSWFSLISRMWGRESTGRQLPDCLYNQIEWQSRLCLSDINRLEHIGREESQIKESGLRKKLLVLADIIVDGRLDIEEMDVEFAL